MNYACPACGANLRQKKLAQAVVAHMELDCQGCKSRVQLNVHAAEIAIMLLGCAGFLILAVLAHCLQSQPFLLGAFACAAAAWSALRVLERTTLRAWPRYVRKGEM